VQISYPRSGFRLASGRLEKRRSDDSIVDERFDRIEPIPRIERRHLVRPGKRRVVEDRVDEVIDRPLEAHHRLSDVNDLGCVSPEDMDAQDRAVFPRDEEL